MDIVKWSIQKAMERSCNEDAAKMLMKCTKGVNFNADECKIIADAICKNVKNKRGRPKERSPGRDLWLMVVYGLCYLSEVDRNSNDKTKFRNRESAQQAFCEEQLGIGGFSNGTFIKIYKEYGRIARSFIQSKK